MKALTIRLPEVLIAQIEAESRRRKLSKAGVVRERLTLAPRSRRHQPPPLDAVPAPFDAIADLIGSVDGLPPDLSTRTKRYLKSMGHGDKRAR